MSKPIPETAHPAAKVAASAPQVTAAKVVASAPQVTAVKGVAVGGAEAAQEDRLKTILQKQDQALLQAQQKALELEQKIRNLQIAKAATASTAAGETRVVASQPVVAAVASQPVAAVAAVASQPAAVASQPAAVIASAPAAQPAKPAEPAHPPVKAAAPAKPAVEAPPPSSMVDDVLDSLRNSGALMYGGGAAVVGLGALLVAQRLRQRKTAEPGSKPAAKSAADNASMLTMGPLTTLMSGIKRGEGIDLASVDLIAEAEVYLAYGRIDQALEILREGLAREPMRQDLRYKLLEVLAMQPDRDGFIAEATTARGIFGKDSTLWMRVCELGRTLAPDHPLFDAKPVAAASPLNLEAVRVNAAAAPVVEAAVASAPAEHVPPLDLAVELGAVEPEPEAPLAMDFLDKPAGPAPLPPASESNPALSGLDAFASLGEQELENAVKQAPEPMLSMDFLSDLPASVKVDPPAPAAAALTQGKSQSEANDKMELAKLYLEMGDKETAEALMKEAGQTV